MLVEGAKDFYSNNKLFTLDNTNIAMMNPYEIHSGETLTDKGWKQLVILFDEGASKRFAEENDIKRKHLHFATTVSNDTAFRNEIQKQCAEIINADSELERENNYEILMGLIFTNEKQLNTENLGNNSYNIRKTIIKMLDEPDAKHSLDELSKIAGMSKYHYLRSFKEATGLTPHLYLNVLRVERAKRMLLSSQDQISVIASECGFADQAHMTRAYKKIYGTTPTAIVKK